MPIVDIQHQKWLADKEVPQEDTEHRTLLLRLIFAKDICTKMSDYFNIIIYFNF